MSKSMLINVILEEESRVAIVDNGVLDFFEIETLRKQTLKGYIYKGVVENVNSALEAAFVNCGWERPGFLPRDEVNFRVLPALKGRGTSSKIQDHLAPGMEVLVQVIRDKFDNKPPSLTTFYSLPGRYLVLTPFADASGVSRRIEDEEQRAKLKRLIEELSLPEKYGAIVRTAGLDQDRRELVRDMGYLVRLWETVEQAAASAPAPSLIYKERGLALRTIRDNLTDDIEEVLIDDPATHESAIRFIRAVAPHQEPKIRLYTGDKPLYSRFNLEEQIETLYKRRVPLKSGGEIVIEGTEAMTAIDVNSSRSRESTVEELALRTNLEAASEIARQLRLRDIGGLIVVDFIDMEASKHVRAVEKALFDAMRRDKAKYDATKISKLGILEISRQRLKAAKKTATYITCTACDGAGTVRTTEAASFAALRRIQTRVVRGDAATLSVLVPTDVALYLLNNQRDELLALEKRYHARIKLVPREDFPKERCDIEASLRDAAEAPPSSLREPARAQREQPTGGGLGAEAQPAERSWVGSPKSEAPSGAPPSAARARAGGSEPRPVGPREATLRKVHAPAGARRKRGQPISFSEVSEPEPTPVLPVSEVDSVPGDLGTERAPASEVGAFDDTVRLGEVADESAQPADDLPWGREFAGGSGTGFVDHEEGESLREPGSTRTSEDARSGAEPEPGNEPASRQLDAPERAGPRDSWDASEEGGSDAEPAAAAGEGTETTGPTGAGGSIDAWEGGSGLAAEPEGAAGAQGTHAQRAPVAPEAHEPNGKKRRRRRGGRGRKRPHAADAEGYAAKAVEDEDEASEGSIVWEDAEDHDPEPTGAGVSSISPGSRGPLGAGAVQTAAEAAEAKKRRRRRGGRGRKKHGSSEADSAGTGSVRSGEGAGSVRAGTADRDARSVGGLGPSKPGRALAAEGSGPAGIKKKRRRKHTQKRVPEIAGYPADGISRQAEVVPRPAPSSQSERPGAYVGSGVNKPPAAAETPGGRDEDAPGGWWSRLRGVKKRSDRED